VEAITSTVDVEATILFADALHAAGAHITASHHYSMVLSARPELGLYVNEWMGDALQAAGQPVTASQVYSRALTDAETASERVWLLEKIATVAVSDGDYAGAMAAYDGILDIARIPAYRASIMYRAADTALAFGDADVAYERLAVLLSDYPESDVAHSALIRLVEGGYPVDEMLRGMVNYYSEAYGPAVQAFYRVIVADPDHTGEPHYYAGLSFLAAGSLDLALDEFDLLIETHPDDPLVPAAWIGKGRVQMQLGQEALALESYAVAVESDTELATIEERNALWAAAKDFEEMEAFDSAADLLMTFADRYPGDERAPQARFQAGLLWYRLGDVEAAQDAWRSQTVWYPYDAQAQAAWYWLGKTHVAAGETLSATEALSRAVSLGAWDFYGLQARDMLEGRATFPSDAVVTVPCNTRAVQQEAEAWLASWLNLEPDVDVGVMPDALQNDPRLQRARLLVKVGHFEEGRLELEKLRAAMSHDALALYHLALAFRDLGVYRSSISAAVALWQLSPAQEITALPRFIGCLVYPTYYSELVDQEAAARNLPSLLVYALLRQESLFEGYAMSHAAAHGLMQVIPSTGAAIAEALNWPPDYETADLYRPMVSVRFGAWYLAEQRDFIDGDLFAAMAAYNGGPGNSLRWWTTAGGDPDLFVELIGFSETYRYVRLIREYFGAYCWLYTEAGSSTTP
jgi:soluble lytic murein transglycosylase